MESRTRVGMVNGESWIDIPIIGHSCQPHHGRWEIGMLQGGLFAEESRQELCPGAVVLRGFATPLASELKGAVDAVAAAAPWRHMFTPGGLRMSVAMTNCGECGWVSDHAGYRYTATDPQSGRAWPTMPPVCRELAVRAATEAGFPNFRPDACLINRYAPGVKLSAHQDKDERDLTQPVVSVSLGLTAKFQFGGLRRNDAKQTIALHHGDVVVWGGEARLRYHGVLPLKPGIHPLLGEYRLNLTFRQAQ